MELKEALRETVVCTCGVLLLQLVRSIERLSEGKMNQILMDHLQRHTTTMLNLLDVKITK